LLARVILPIRKNVYRVVNGTKTKFFLDEGFYLITFKLALVFISVLHYQIVRLILVFILWHLAFSCDLYNLYLPNEEQLNIMQD
jgi:hypothetical protein